MTSLKSPWEWSASEVSEFLYKINLGSAVKAFEKLGINGTDLLELTESDLRHDLCFLRVHDRKSLIRSIADLKKSCAICIRIDFNASSFQFRIGDLFSYDFSTLHTDCSTHLHLHPSTFLIKDSKNYPLGSGPVSILYRNYIQKERISISLLSEESSSSISMEDISEDLD